MICGIDFSTHAIDIVGIDNDDGTDAEWQQLRLDHGPTRNAFERTRKVRDAMPPRGVWKDEGVILIAIEVPKGGQASSTIPLQRLFGAILACLPTDIDVLPLPPWEWRKACGMSGSGRTEELKRQAAAFALRHWTSSPERVGQDGLDAYCIAWAARQICNQAAKAAERRNVA